MERQLSLIKTNYQELEKRVFPRFPFGFMIFKEVAPGHTVFEVQDASLSGMRLFLKDVKDGAHQYRTGEKIAGNLHWRDSSVSIKAKVQWVHGASLGISFDSDIRFEEQMKTFLSFENIVSHIRPIHQGQLGVELPNNLKYWLKSDGVFDLYVWEYPSQGILRFQVFIMEHFIEWEEGTGLRSGQVVGQRDLQTPLSTEGEMLLQIDEKLNADKVEIALGVVKKIYEKHLPTDAREFLIYKLGG